MTDSTPPTIKVTEHGLEWGPLVVECTATLPDDRTVVTLRTPFRELRVFTSATGRALRVFGPDGELTAGGDA